MSAWTGTPLIVFGGNDASTPRIEVGTHAAQVTVTGTINGNPFQKTADVTLMVTP